jgi:hypothetical protein
MKVPFPGYFESPLYMYIQYDVEARVMMFNTTFNNISAIAWWSVLLVEGTGIPGEKKTNRRHVTANLYHIMLNRVHHAISEIQTNTVSGSYIRFHPVYRS